ncbi:helix-turn-helix domain-containing protein [Burkholderia glumae]|uniref:Helix-turn-helix transcriptional regulator n=1 Tax=Burkholderia glumae TaxID=337 RepID=A0AAP9Y3F8_BURGL|nr:helix-turn-helix transcriptional regulator [Burkholderia glumae]ACR28365.1 Putative helix-turn-helix transcriptional regulator [Burkholderia glumae BGR1]AJY65449.1 helix-turn-helix family protein [Burkholderia glumae LMG 2196 = ATCC 33617]KHJ61193.1 XRE family transcriptional regulator [Burkholderia glumae]MCR1770732.1 helix-turn-helix transcriptional regulator [Burkholderia glumae]NVE21985.1 helix-turn-helix transcriptional regulator [Burkholderia glumae]
MTKVQFIERDGQPAFAVVPIEVWDRVKHLVEDLEDEAQFAQAKAQDDGERIPAAVLDAELAGDHPVRAWRNHRRLTQDALATAAGISKPYLSQIETRQRVGTTDALVKIAHALNVSIAVLIEPTAEKK